MVHQSLPRAGLVPESIWTAHIRLNYLFRRGEREKEKENIKFDG